MLVVIRFPGEKRGNPEYHTGQEKVFEKRVIDLGIPFPLSSESVYFHDHQGDIIELRLALAERKDGTDDCINDLLGRCATVFLDNIYQPGEIEHFLAFVHCLGDTIGVEDDEISCHEGYRFLLIDCVFKGPDSDTGRFEFFDRACLVAEYEGRVVAGIDIGDEPFRRYRSSRKKG